MIPIVESRDAYNRAAQVMTQQHANESLEKCRQKLTGASESPDVTISHPKHFVCPLTNTIFEDPVNTIHGQ